VSDGFSVSPTPTDEEAVALVAAIDATWPRPVAEGNRDDAPRWRWSGRWWTKPMALRRERPYF
jgi:hypothetical protein